MDSEVDPSGLTPTLVQEAQEQRTLPSHQQAEAIRSDSDAVLLLAPPGTGKTRVLRARLAYLINKGVPRSSILVVTFTNHAAQQLKLRVGALADGGLDGVWLGTFHSICARMLREHAHLLNLSPNFVVLAESEQIALLASLMTQVGMRRGGGRPGSGAAPPGVHGTRGSSAKFSAPSSGVSIPAAAGIASAASPTATPADATPAIRRLRRLRRRWNGPARRRGSGQVGRRGGQRVGRSPPHHVLEGVWPASEPSARGGRAGRGR